MLITEAKKQRALEFLQETESAFQMDVPNQQNKNDRLNASITFIAHFSTQKKLTEDDLAKWIKYFVPHAQLDQTQKAALTKIANACNETLTRISPASSDREILLAMSDCIWTVESEKTLSIGKHNLALLIGAGVAERCQRAIPIFPADKKVEFLNAVQSKQKLYEYLRQIMRDNVYGPSGVLMHAVKHDGFDTTYIGPDGERLIVQWNDLYKEETYLNNFLKGL